MSKNQKTSTKGLRPPKKHSSKEHAKVYWPYLPLIIILFGGLFLNIWQPLQNNKPATLAYSTEMSNSSLLSATNAQRANNGSPALSSNGLLSAAAQAKANDMVARDYWSHNTPDGQEPWIFIDAQGYNYTKAGENLAYGFSTSSETVIGWMNSPSHKANLLDTAFSEVGFGFANSANFVGTGEETIVVAMYGAPYGQTKNSNKTVAKPVAQATPAPTPEPEPAPVSQPVTEDRHNQPVNTEFPIPSFSQTQRITLLQQLTGGDAPWSAIALSIFAITLVVAWLFKHFLVVRRFVMEGEFFVAHHPVFDLIVVLIVAVAIYLSQSSGVIL